MKGWERPEDFTPSPALFRKEPLPEAILGFPHDHVEQSGKEGAKDHGQGAATPV